MIWFGVVIGCVLGAIVALAFMQIVAAWKRRALAAEAELKRCEAALRDAGDARAGDMRK